MGADEHRYWLLKLNAEDCPGKIGKPRKPADWDNKEIHGIKPRKSKNRRPLAKDEIAEPNIGDRFLIWVNEEKGGAGLTASGSFGAASGGSLRLKEIEILRPLKMTNSDLDKLKKQEDIAPNIKNIAADIRESAVAALRSIKHDGFDFLLQEAMKNAQPTQGKPAPSGPNGNAKSGTPPQENTEPSYRLIEQRQNQSRFRREAIARDGELCAVSGCTEICAIDAAHIVAYAEGEMGRDNLGNALLLRSDLHNLFDYHLLSIKPESLTVQVSDKIKDEHYRKFHGCKATTGADRKQINKHFEKFQKLNKS